MPTSPRQRGRRPNPFSQAERLAFIARLFLADFNNQFGSGSRAALQTFLQGFEVTPPRGMFVVKEGDNLGVDDLLRFYFSTGFAQTPVGLDDELRRFGNVVATAGGFQPGDIEEAEGILLVRDQFLKDKRGSLSNFSKVYTALEQPAKGFLIVQKALGHPIDEVLVGLSDSGDPIQGTGKNDLLLGHDSHDILIGGGGNDVLRGEEGKDLYIYKTGDGQDVIVDAPALGGDGLGAEFMTSACSKADSRNKGSRSTRASITKSPIPGTGSQAMISRSAALRGRSP